MSWRARARAAIHDAIIAAANEPAPLDPDEARAAIIARIDAAYPFGPRQHWPYKQWLIERRAAITRLNADAATPGGRDCPACGARPGRPCRDIVGGQAVAWHVARVDAARAAQPSSGPLFGEVAGG